MKQSMQVIAMVAFLGCFAILAIAAGTGKARLQENCEEEWKKILPEKKKAADTRAGEHKHRIAQCTPRNRHEVIFPVQLFHAML